MNKLLLEGVLSERHTLRFTPAGLPVTECTMLHESTQIEAGKARKVECTVNAVGLGDIARWLQAVRLGTLVKVEGFIAQKTQKNPQLRLHITHIELIEGNKHGQVP